VRSRCARPLRRARARRRPTASRPPPPRARASRWDNLENNPALQAYTNYALGFAYGAVALVALVRGAREQPPAAVARSRRDRARASAAAGAWRCCTVAQQGPPVAPQLPPCRAHVRAASPQRPPRFCGRASAPPQAPRPPRCRPAAPAQPPLLPLLPSPQVQLVRIQLRVPEYGWTTQKCFHALNSLVSSLRAASFLFRSQMDAVHPTVLRLVLYDLPGAPRETTWGGAHAAVGPGCMGGHASPPAQGWHATLSRRSAPFPSRPSPPRPRPRHAPAPSGLIFFTTYTLLVLFWAEIYHQARSMPTGSLRPIFVGFNALVYAIQVRLRAGPGGPRPWQSLGIGRGAAQRPLPAAAVCLRGAAAPAPSAGRQPTHPRTCLAPKPQGGLWAYESMAAGDAQARVSHVLSAGFLAAVSLAAAIGFLLYGGRLFLMLQRFPIESRGRKKKLREVGMVTTICAACFTIRWAPWGLGGEGAGGRVGGQAGENEDGRWRGGEEEPKGGCGGVGGRQGSRRLALCRWTRRWTCRGRCRWRARPETRTARPWHWRRAPAPGPSWSRCPHWTRRTWTWM
jgi:hypothetical protein